MQFDLAAHDASTSETQKPARKLVVNHWEDGGKLVEGVANLLGLSESVWKIAGTGTAPPKKSSVKVWDWGDNNK